MSTQRFSHTQYPVNALVEQIDSGELSLPDLQRPFVWSAAKVRDLFDSLYHGYPAGYFLFWSTPAAVDSHHIGTDSKNSAGLKMIVDGQQRLTSLYAVIKGREILTEDHQLRAIRISFNPLTEEFAVADAARANDPEWLTNISDVWTTQGGGWAFTNSFIETLSEARELEASEKQAIGASLGKLESLSNYQFSALDLSADLDIDEVAEVFVRINSQGIALNSADFILTLMSVHRKDARHRLEDFSREANLPSADTSASPYNHFLAPSPDQLLRVAVGLGLHRGVLRAAYQALRGRDPESKTVSGELRDQQFDLLEEAQERVLNLTNWHEYIVAVKSAGYRSGAMLTSDNNFLYCYLIFLLGRYEHDVEHTVLRRAVARWFFMSSLTGRYTGSPESILEADLRRFMEADGPEAFVQLIDQLIKTQLTDDYWKVTLPEYLESSAAWSPYLFAYHASLNLLDATALFSNMKIGELLDPGVQQPKSPVERHHLFPRAYLASIGVTGTTRQNQIANYAFVEWADNIDIASQEPRDYYPRYMQDASPDEKVRAEFWHALAPNWYEMDYPDFLADRRERLAQVVKRGFEKLDQGSEAFAPSHIEQSGLPSVGDLLRKMETRHVEFKRSARASLENDAPESVINDSIVKTVAAFLNSGGGTLAIGISDEGDVLGLQADLDFKKQDLDSYENWLNTLLLNRISGGTVAAHVGTRIEVVGSEEVCLVDVRPSSSAVYAKTSKSEHCFYVRAGNSTRMLEGPDIQSYLAGAGKTTIP